MDDLAAMYHPGTVLPGKLSDRPATIYFVHMADSEGCPLAGGKTCKLNVPKDVPVKQLWALMVYDFAT